MDRALQAGDQEKYRALTTFYTAAVHANRHYVAGRLETDSHMAESARRIFRFHANCLPAGTFAALKRSDEVTKNGRVFRRTIRSLGTLFTFLAF